MYAPITAYNPDNAAICFTKHCEKLNDYITMFM